MLPALAGGAGDPEHGAELAGLAGCAACHTAPGGAPLAGGYALETEYGTFFGSNLTPDPTGLGGWSFDDFVRALRAGKSPDGRPYAPAFPYDQFTGLTDADLRDLWAWLQSQAPVAHDVPAHDASRRATSRFWLGLWRLLYLRKGPWEPDPERSAVENRGAYLVEHVGHCGGCHTPRNRNGARKRDEALTGNDQPPEPGPPLVGLGWDEADWIWFLETGTLPDGDVVGGEMWRVIEEGTARLSDEDRAAIAAWIRSR